MHFIWREAGNMGRSITMTRSRFPHRTSICFTLAASLVLPMDESDLQ